MKDDLPASPITEPDRENSQSGSTPKQKAYTSPWRAFLAALQFLTVFPALTRRPFTDGELGGAVAWFPLVGTLIGLLVALASVLFALFLPPQVRAALVLTLWVLLTGALHLDGFLDTCDGLLGGDAPEKRLAIMRDERIGAFALVGGVLLLLLKYSALHSGGLLPISKRWEPFLLAPLLSRWAMSLAIVAFPYARQAGLGRTMKDHAGWAEVIVASIFTLILAWFVGQWIGLALFFLAAITCWLLAWFTIKRISGFTGDVYGALNEIVECLVLVGWVAFNG
jgi:adenosylcobinamide-GDP ribazoletransferase